VFFRFFSTSGSFTQFKNIRDIPGFETSRKYKSCNGLQCRPCSKNCADLLFLSTEEVARIIEEEVSDKKTGIEAWSDASVCLWLKSSGGGHPTPLNEAKKRGISCN
jgi:hypothetical protein